MNIELAKVLLPYQRRWIADTADVKIAEKARRIGFTWAEALALVLDAAPARDDGGLNGWYVGYNKEMAREFIDDCAYWIRQLTGAAADPADCLVRDEERDIQAYEIRLASGNKITALSSTPRNLRGKEGVAVLDEAAWHRDLASLLKAALAFLTWGKGSDSLDAQRRGEPVQSNRDRDAGRRAERLLASSRHFSRGDRGRLVSQNLRSAPAQLDGASSSRLDRRDVRVLRRRRGGRTRLHP